MDSQADKQTERYKKTLDGELERLAGYVTDFMRRAGEPVPLRNVSSSFTKTIQKHFHMEFRDFLNMAEARDLVRVHQKLGERTLLTTEAGVAAMMIKNQERIKEEKEMAKRDAPIRYRLTVQQELEMHKELLNKYEQLVELGEINKAEYSYQQFHTDQMKKYEV